MKRENIERRREKWSEAERWSVRESRLREIKKKAPLLSVPLHSSV